MLGLGRGGAAFVAAAAGVIVQLLGPVGLSRWWAEPLYDRISAWPIAGLPDEWAHARDEWRRINRWRIATSLAVFLLMLGAVLVGRR